MKKQGHLLQVLFLALIFMSCSADTKPTSQEIDPVLSNYLASRMDKNCQGQVVVNSVSIERIGDFRKDYGGWPVYAAFNISCIERNNRRSWTDDGKRAPAAFVRRNSSGEIEFFIPEKIRAAEEMINRKIREMSGR